VRKDNESDITQISLIHILLADINQLEPEMAKFNHHTFVGDSAVSRHMGFCDDGMFDTVPYNNPIRFENNKTVFAVK